MNDIILNEEIHKATPSPWGSVGASVEKIDAVTFKFKFKKPYTGLLYYLIMKEELNTQRRIFIATHWQLMWWRFRKHRLAMTGSAVLAFNFMGDGLRDAADPFAK